MNTSKPIEAYAFMNALVKAAIGEDSTLQAVDTSSFVSCGDQVLSTGVENTLNAISEVLGRTIVSARPYSAKLKLIDDADTGAFTNKMRKICFRAQEALPEGGFNTVGLDGSTPYKTNIKDGYDNGSNGGASVASMWEQHLADPVEINFASRAVWSDCLTRTEDQLKIAFRGESEFMAFISGIATEKASDIERQREAWARTTLLNRLAANIAMSKNGEVLAAGGTDDHGTASMAINVTKAFNDEFGTSYTTKQLKTTYLKEFMEFFTYLLKYTSDRMENSTGKFHYQYPRYVGSTKAGIVLRHTPKSRQKLMLYSPLFLKAQSYVFPEIFNPQYLSIGNYEGVTMWQDWNSPEMINVVPSLPEIDAGEGQQPTEEAVHVEVLGIIFDTDAIKSQMQYERAAATPLEARKLYSNVWWHFGKGAINDFSESSVVFYMEDAEEVVES